jgi:hypothetical protein
MQGKAGRSYLCAEGARTLRASGALLAVVALLLGVALLGAGCGGGGGAAPSADTGGPGPDTGATDSGGSADTGSVEPDARADTGGPGPDVPAPPDSGPGEDVPRPDGGAETSVCPAGAPCNDHDPCTRDDRCSAAGVCAGTPYTCDDGLDCTTDACDGAGGCTVELALGACVIDGACYRQGDAQAGAPCNACRPDVDPYVWTDNEGGTCEDGDRCTVGDRCRDGVCVPGLGTLPCNDNDLCTGVESCDPATGCVAGTPLECDDGNACNGEETCDPLAGCQVGTPLACNDGNVCNGVETCDPASGCVAGTPLACDDGDACNGVEGCHPSTGCTTGVAPQCDDGRVCNGVETCDPASGCVDAPDLDCDDRNDCTVDACSEPGGCIHQSRTGACDDGNPCTARGTCSGGVCVGAGPLCPAGEFCAVGCDETAQVWCLGADPYPLDCADYGATCGLVGDEPRCVCDDQYAARCAGGSLILCADGALGQYDCAAAGAGCGVGLDGVADCRCDAGAHEPVCTDNANLAVCTEAGTIGVLPCGAYGGVCRAAASETDRCACGAGFAPSCVGSAQVVCSGGADGDLLTVECDVFGTTCGAAGAAEGCVCGAGSAPLCVDDFLLTCEAGGVAALVDCAAQGGTCGAGAGGRATCLGGGCPQIPATNLCAGTELHRCVDGREVVTDCATQGLVCAADPTTGANGCRAESAGCGAVTAAGECNGDLVLWCDEGVLQQFDCGHYGASCGAWAEAGFFWCDCSGAAFQPGCFGSLGLAQCRDDGWLEVADCSALGGTCGAGDQGRAACVGEGCGGETFLGRCAGESIVWCEDRLVRTLDCASGGLTCAWDLGGGFYNCLAAPPDCSAIPAVGACTRGDVLETCDAHGHAIGIDCAASGRSCAYSEAAGAMTCVGCAGVPAEGVCDGDVLYWCGSNLVQAFDCAPWDTSCGPDGMGGSSCRCDPGGYAASCVGEVLLSCHPYGVLQTTDCDAVGATCGAGDGGALACVGSGCGGETFAGRCAGGTLTWCENRLVRSVDCALYGYECGFEAGRAIWNCLPPQGDCGGESPEGRCEGDVLVWCDTTGGYRQPRRKDCAALSRVCDETDDPGVFGCVAAGDCGGETWAGRCAGEVLVWCAEGAVHRVDCAVGGLHCDDGAPLADCVDPTVGCGGVTFFGSCEGGVLRWCDGDVVRTVDCAVGGLVCGPDGLLGMNCVRPETAAACDPACPPGFLCVAGMCRANGTQSRDWTYLVYLAGDNNLSPAALGDIAEMEQVGTGPRVAVVALAEFSAAAEAPAALRGDTFRFRVPYAPAAGPDVATIAAGAIGNRNLGDPATLTEFIRWAAQTYPAKRFALVLWNHGGGWMGGFQDETSADDLTLREIHDGIRAAGIFLDVVDFDACLMGMYEIAAELSDVAAYVVASEEVEPGCGNPYHEILGALTANPSWGGRALATATVDEYIAWYGSAAVDPGCRLDVTKAALDLSRAGVLHERLSAFATALEAERRAKRSTILALFGASQAFHFPFFRDVVDLAERVAASSLSQPAREAATALVAAVAGADGIVIRNGVLEQTGINDLSGAHGLSVFAPDLVDAQTYPGLLQTYVTSLTWRQRQSAWSLFLERLLGTDGTYGVPASGRVRLRWFANQAGTVPGDANVDLWLIDPSNALYGPLLGRVTPNGTFSPESTVAGASQESFTWADQVSPGSYLFLVVYDGHGSTNRIAWPELTIDLAGAAGYPVTLRRVDGSGQELPMNLDAALPSPIGRIMAGDLTPAEIDGMWLNRYGNVWMIPVVNIE